jgi:YHS domain-containing protein
MEANNVSEQATDQVCGMKVDPGTAPSSTVQGVDYYFCCENCKRTFDRKPSLYVGHPPGR